MENKVGRPPMFKNAEDFENKVNEYFVSIQGEFHWEEESDRDGNVKTVKVWDIEPEPPTITGLCLYLGFESRQSFYAYEAKEEFSYTVKKARLRIESEYEKSAIYARSPVFHIFALKNLGWKDKQEVDSNVTIKEFNIKEAIKFVK